MDKQLIRSKFAIGSIYFCIVGTAIVAFQFVFNCHSSQASQCEKRLDRSLTTKKLFANLKVLLKDSKDLSIDCEPEKGTITFHSKKPVKYLVRIPNMIGELQKERTVPGPADGGFMGDIKLIAGDTSRYQAVFPQSFPFFYNRGEVLFTQWAWASYSKKFNFHIRANFSCPKKTTPPQLAKFARFVTDWESSVQTIQ